MSIKNNTFFGLSLVTLFTVLTMLCGCNTVDGVGEDIGEAGDAIEDAAE